MPIPKFLTDEKVKLPIGGDFAPSGFIGAWYAQVVYAFYSETDIATIEDAPKPDAGVRKQGNGFRYYYKSPDAAEAAREALGAEIKAHHTWHWLCERKHVLNFADADLLARFSDPVSFELKVTTLKSKKHRHELHLIALPSAVAAMATALGYQHPGFSLTELLVPDAIFDDALQLKMIGNADVGYADAELWKRRVELWRALGEENAEAYTVDGERHSTGAPKLRECLAILNRQWRTALWSRLVTVPDPRVDAVFGDEAKRLTIPALTEIFDNEKAARAAAQRDIERIRTSTAVGAKSADDKPIPAAWAELPDEWNEQVAKLREEFAGKPRPVVLRQLKAREKELGATAEEILAWL